MKWLKKTCLVIILMLPLTLLAAPHEPSFSETHFKLHTFPLARSLA